MEQPKKEASELAQLVDPWSDSSCDLIIDWEENPGSTELDVKSKDNVVPQTDTKFKNDKNLEIKRKAKAIRKTYCLICKIDFLSEDKMVDHNSEVHHRTDDIFMCFGCKKKFKGGQKRFQHENDSCKSLEQGFYCEKCENFLPTRKTWEQHYVAHLNNMLIPVRGNLFKCRICDDTTFKSKQLFNKHIKKYHNGYSDNNLEYICDICGRTFIRKDSLTLHQMYHYGMKRHKCPQCDYSCVQKSTLTSHLRKHTGERPYTCFWCKKRFSSSSNLLKHTKDYLCVKQFRCNLCDEKFFLKQSLQDHLGSAHNRSVTYSCEHCSSTFVILASLKRHLAKKHNIKVDNKLFKQQYLAKKPGSDYETCDQEKNLQKNADD